MVRYSFHLHSHSSLNHICVSLLSQVDELIAQLVEHCRANVASSNPVEAPATSQLLKLRPGGVLPIVDYTGRLRPKGVPFSGVFQVYKRVGISRAEV